MSEGCFGSTQQQHPRNEAEPADSCLDASVLKRWPSLPGFCGLPPPQYIPHARDKGQEIGVLAYLTCGQKAADPGKAEPQLLVGSGLLTGRQPRGNPPEREKCGVLSGILAEGRLLLLVRDEIWDFPRSIQTLIWQQGLGVEMSPVCCRLEGSQAEPQGWVLHGGAVLSI